MPRNWFTLALSATLIALGLAAPGSTAEPDPSGVAFFEKKIRPVLVERCYKCHSDEAKKSRGGLRLDARAALLQGGDSGPALVPGRPQDSLLIKAIRHAAGELKMPPDARLSDAVVADFVKWVELGAPDPRDGKAKSAPALDVVKARKAHWAFQPFRQTPPPRVQDATWIRTPVDAFILRRLEDKGIRPAAAAEPLTWLRRVHFDLTGLPPTPEEQHAFLKDLSPRSYERVVDDLLSRPQYGERWGRHWLDVARYGETKGYEGDGTRPFTWRYRDWVIDAFNRDLPYDAFLTQQLAGDELPNADARSQIATVFLNLGPFDTIAADAKQGRYDHLDDVVGTTASAFLGMTLQCARCHDHKFEPLAQLDYYRILAAFDGMKIDGQVQVGTAAELAAFRQANDTADVELLPLFDELGKIADPLLTRAEQQGGIKGKKTKLDAKQVGNLLKTLRSAADKRIGGKQGRARPAAGFSKELGRLEDALREVAAPAQLEKVKAIREQVKAIDAKRPQPLLAPAYSDNRKGSAVTRLLIRGEPSRPGPEVAFALPAVFASGDSPPAKGGGQRLWLARWMTGPGQALTARVMANRLWQYHFGQGFLADANDLGLNGGTPTHPELLEWLAQDLVQNGWRLKRMHRQLVLSSTYRQSAAHPRPEQDPDNRLLSRWPLHRLEAEAIRDSLLALSGRLSGDLGGPSVNGVDSPRRSVYLTVKRSAPLPELALLGTPDSSTSCARRNVSTTPVQSLLLLNGKFANAQAKLFAERLRQEAGPDLSAQVRRAFERTLCRPPRGEELQSALAFVRDARSGSSQEALAAFCLILFNTNEFVYRN